MTMSTGEGHCRERGKGRGLPGRVVAGGSHIEDVAIWSSLALFEVVWRGDRLVGYGRLDRFAVRQGDVVVIVVLVVVVVGDGRCGVGFFCEGRN